MLNGLVYKLPLITGIKNSGFYFITATLKLLV